MWTETSREFGTRRCNMLPAVAAICKQISLHRAQPASWDAGQSLCDCEAVNCCAIAQQSTRPQKSKLTETH